VLYHNFEAWKHHFKLHHAEKTWKCLFRGLCHSRTFSTKDRLKDHLITAHDDESWSENALQFLVEKHLKLTIFAIKYCPICTRSEEDFDDASTMRDHIAEELFAFALEAIPDDGEFLEYSTKSQKRKSGSDKSNKVEAALDHQRSSTFN